MPRLLDFDLDARVGIEAGRDNVSDKEKFDTENLQTMMETAVRFLEVNEFDISGEPDYSDMENEKFIEIIEKRLLEGNDVLQNMERVNIEITFRSAMSGVFNLKKDEDHRILVLFFSDESSRTNSIGKESVKKFENLMLYLNCIEGLMVSEKGLASMIKKEMRNCNIESTLTSKIYNTIFYRDDEFINIVDHILSPKILKIFRTDKEIDQFRKENPIDITKIPSILSSDPLVKFFRAKVGNIFKFRRVIVNNDIIPDFEISFRMVTAS